MVDLALQLGVPALLLALTFLTGKVVDVRHLRRLAQEEAALKDIIVTNLRSLPHGLAVESAFLCAGVVVIANTYFKSFGALLKNFVGGHIGAMEILLERARREALVRMLKQARQRDAQAVINVRFERSTVGTSKRGKQQMFGVEVMAYGTALKLEREATEAAPADAFAPVR